MKKDDVVVGGTYAAKVGARTLDVRIEGENAKGGWNATAVDSGKPVRIKDARHLRPAAGAVGRSVEPVDADATGAADAGDGAPDADGAPAAVAAKKRGGKKGEGAKAPKQTASTPRSAKEKRMSCLDAAAAVLKAKGEPMRCKEMVAQMKDQGLWTTDAPTPEATLYSAILRELAKGKDSRFRKTDRGHFGLNTK